MQHSVFVAVKQASQTVGLEKIIYSKKAALLQIYRKDVGPDGTPKSKKLKKVSQFNLTKHEPVMVDSALKDVRVILRDANQDVVYSDKLDLSKYGKKESKDDRDSKEYHRIKTQIAELMQSFEGSISEKQDHTFLLSQASGDDSAKAYVKSHMTYLLLKELSVSDKIVDALVDRLYGDLYGLGVIQPLDDDMDVSEIMINAKAHPTFSCYVKYMKNGKMYWFDKKFETIDEVMQVFENALRFDKKQLNMYERPKIEATRPNGDRVTVSIPEASKNYSMNIRKLKSFVPTYDEMIAKGTVTKEIAELYELLVIGKANIGIGGAMNTGKTAFINYGLTYTEPIERKVVIASVNEMDLDGVLSGHDIVVFLVDDTREDLSFASHLSTALRKTADRIIVPESRSGEAKPLYEAMQKIRGNLFTAHASSAEAFMDVMVDMYLSNKDVNASEPSMVVKNKLAKAIDVVMIMRRVGKDIRLQSVSEVMQSADGKYAGMNDLFVFDFDPEDPTKGTYRRTHNQMSNRLKKVLNEHGVPMSRLEAW